jgi:DNA-binding CsgD family transcriptional regulator
MARKRKTRRPRHSRKLSSRSLEARNRALHALTAIRHGASLADAAKSEGVSQRTIRKYVGSALRQDHAGGRIRAVRTDRFTRHLQIPGPNGPIEIQVRGSKAASEFARYKAAVNRFLRGDRHALADWHGKKIAEIELITAGNTLKSLAEKDLIPYSLYRSLSGGAA